MKSTSNFQNFSFIINVALNNSPTKAISCHLVKTSNLRYMVLKDGTSTGFIIGVSLVLKSGNKLADYHFEMNSEYTGKQLQDYVVMNNASDQMLPIPVISEKKYQLLH